MIERFYEMAKGETNVIFENLTKVRETIAAKAKQFDAAAKNGDRTAMRNAISADNDLQNLDRMLKRCTDGGCYAS